MWELLLALFGGAYITTKVASEKAELKRASQSFEEKQQRLRAFRNSVTSITKVNAVNDYMCMEESKERIEAELHELFSLVPELNGLEHCWIYSNHSPPACNWGFIEFILCVNRGCVPLTKQYDFRIDPYYIGNGLDGRPRYVSISATSREIITKWIVDKLDTYGVKIGIVYKNTGGLIGEYVWTSKTE